MIKAMCFILLLAGSQLANCAVTFKQAEIIFNRLLAVNNITNKPKLVYVALPDTQAAASGNTIYIYKGMLDFAKNDDEIARVLGHELGHIKLHHMISTIQNEFDADQVAITYLEKAGYDKCVAGKLLYRRNSEGGYNHPPDRERYKRFNC